MPKRSLDTAFMAVPEGSVPTSRQPNSLFVSFSKRRKGLFQKAADLCKICGAEVAVIVISPSGNPFSLGHSSVDAVLRRHCHRRTPSSNITNYPPATTGRGGAISEKHRKQAEQVEALKARVTENIEGLVLRELKASVEQAWESCEAAEVLEFLKWKFLELLENVRTRLMLLRSSSFSGEGKVVVVGTGTDLVGQVQFADECLISGTGFDGKLVGQTNTTVVGPVVLDDFHVLPCSQNDMSYLLPKFDEVALVVDQTNYGSGAINDCDSSTNLEELLGNCVFNQCLINGGFNDDLGGGESSLAEANVFGNIRPCAVMSPSNDMSYGEPDSCADSCDGEMVVQLPDDEVFNCLGQLPSFYDLKIL